MCELHFRKEDFEDDRSFRTGMQRQRRRLKSGAVLSVLTSVDYAMPPVHERPAKLAMASARHSHQKQVMKDQTDAFFTNDNVSYQVATTTGRVSDSSWRMRRYSEVELRASDGGHWSRFSPADASARMAPSASQQERQQDGALVIQEPVAAVAKSTEMEDLDDSAKASLGHSSGALARSATRRNKYGASASLLIYLGATPLEYDWRKTRKTSTSP